MSTNPDSPSRRRPRWPWLLLLVLLAAAAGGGYWWQVRQGAERAAHDDARVRLDALEQRMQSLRNDLRANREQLRQNEATNRVLREELLGIGERAALLEDSFDRLADPERQSVQALRLDEAELLLGQGRQRLQIAGDLEGARVAYDLAAGVLASVDDPAFLSLRQTLAQERAALQALGADPRVAALAALDDFARRLRPTSAQPSGLSAAGSQPWWRRAFAALVQVQPSDRAVATGAGDRAAAQAALQLELTLARAAAERRDVRAWRSALQRAGQWLARLWPASAALDRHRARLRALAALPLSPSLPTLGSTLRQLRQLRGSGPARPAGPSGDGPLVEDPTGSIDSP